MLLFCTVTFGTESLESSEGLPRRITLPSAQAALASGKAGMPSQREELPGCSFRSQPRGTGSSGAAEGSGRDRELRCARTQK